MSGYNPCAGESVIQGSRSDKHGNAFGANTDLAPDNSFCGHCVVIGCFYTGEGMPAGVQSTSVPALQAKGFTVRFTVSEQECAQLLSSNDVSCAWIISNSGTPDGTLLSAVNAFHQRGKGLFVFGDNVPYVAHANAFLASYQCSLTGNYYGGQMMVFDETASPSYTAGSPPTGSFKKHLIFTGIKNLFEGITICHPVTQNAAFQNIATATDGSCCISVLDSIPSEYNGFETTINNTSVGRVCIDCGFTKLFCNWDDAGTAKYIVNATCWLIGIERRAPRAQNSSSASPHGNEPCRWGTRCREQRSGCKYWHPSSSSASSPPSSSSSSSKGPCKWGSRCRDQSSGCKYDHPNSSSSSSFRHAPPPSSPSRGPCRYGARCRDQGAGCKYDHPSQ